MELSLNEKVPCRYGQGNDEVFTVTQTHLLTPASQATGQIVQGLGCCLLFLIHPFQSQFYTDISWSMGLRENLSLEDPASGSKAVLKDTWKSWFGLIASHLCFSQRRNPNQREITLHIQKGMMSLPLCPGVKTHSVPWYSKWSFSASSAFWLNIALYGPTPMLTVLPSVLMGSHTKSPVHNVIPVPSIFETFDLNINNYPGAKVQIWPMAYGH